jgi:hypothetical protein
MSASSMKRRTAADILMSARATLPNPRSAHGRLVSHGASLVNLESFDPLDEFAVPISQDKGKLTKMAIVFAH